MSQLILISLKVAHFHLLSESAVALEIVHIHSHFFSNLEISVVITQLCTEKVPIFQHILLLKWQCFELLANIITRVPTSFLKNANLLWPWSSHWVIRKIPHSCQNMHVESMLPLKRHNLVSSKQSPGESHLAQNTLLKTWSSTRTHLFSVHQRVRSWQWRRVLWVSQNVKWWQ